MSSTDAHFFLFLTEYFKQNTVLATLQTKWWNLFFITIFFLFFFLNKGFQKNLLLHDLQIERLHFSLHMQISSVKAL